MLAPVRACPGVRAVDEHARQAAQPWPLAQIRVAGDGVLVGCQTLPFLARVPPLGAEVVELGLKGGQLCSFRPPAGRARRSRPVSRPPSRSGTRSLAFDALAGAIRARETLKLYRRPRLADWGEYAAGVYEALGWGSYLFLEDWDGVVRTQNQATLEGSPVAQVIVAFMENHRGDYEGVASDLHRRLELRAEELDIDVKRAKVWPKSPSWLWRRMKDVVPVLAALGIIASTRPGEAGSLISLKKDPLGPPDPGSSREKCSQESPPASRMLPGGNADT